MRKTVEERFWDKVDKNGPNGCWEWTGSVSSTGYGQLAIYRKPVKAHRMSVILDGRDPTGMLVCHTCDNRTCVNPDHLFIGTFKDNHADMMKKQRHVFPKNTANPRKLTDDQVREIRASQLTQRQLAAKYDVTKSVITCVINRKTYQDVT